ncbi:hypothetical protein [Actinomadura sp. 9N407]|uniref:hypothetical protein n=1 Tax=Actinomadura sp. 9N407 TaxID=3375154 RepID=UPI0037A1D4FE
MKKSRWKFWPGPKSRPTIARAGRAELDGYLSGGAPGGTARDRLRLLIVYVVFEHRDRDAVLEFARRCEGTERAEEFIQGNVVAGFRWESVKDVLAFCGAGPDFIEMARELFDEAGVENVRGTGDGGADVSMAPAGGDEGRGAPEPDPREASTAQELIELMQAYRGWKGRPSYRKMAAGSRYAHTTFSQLSTRNSLPKLEFVLDYIKGCGADEDELGNWRAAWQRLELAKPEPPGRSGSEHLDGAPG